MLNLVFALVTALVSSYSPPMPEEDPFYVPPGHEGPVMCIPEWVEISFYVDGVEFVELMRVCTGAGQ